MTLPDQKSGLPGAADSLEGVVNSLFRSRRKANSGSMVIAFSSSLRGEGVSYVTRTVFDVIRQASPGVSLQVDMEWLKNQEGVAEPGESVRHPLWATNWEFRKELISRLRSQHQYVGVDCQSLAASEDVLSLAPLVDGVILVVEADRTKRTQIIKTSRRIEGAGGKVLGLVLNKRRYQIPRVIYDLL